MARSRVFLNTVIVPSPLARERAPIDATDIRNVSKIEGGVAIMIRSCALAKYQEYSSRPTHPMVLWHLYDLKDVVLYLNETTASLYSATHCGAVPNISSIIG